MHPAFSVIFFTTTSGLGYGLMFLFAVFSALGFVPVDKWFVASTLFVALGLQAVGLLSSTFHLRHPERAWRALSQWQSSWLSREGVFAILSFIAPGLWFLGVVFDELPAGAALPLALVSALGAVVVVSCTAMIYASLRSIPRWHHPLVLPLYLTVALGSGGVALALMLTVFGVVSLPALVISMVLLAAAWVMVLLYWRSIDRADATSTANTATGLSGEVRLLDAPHTEANYLMTEMGFKVARKHAAKLRRHAVILGAVLPMLLMMGAIFTTGITELFLMLLAALLMYAGLLVSRWLFFAQAEHVVMLYYGEQAA